MAKATRRKFTAEYKPRILKKADACDTPGAIGKLLRKEGLYTSTFVRTGVARVPDPTSAMDDGPCP